MSSGSFLTRACAAAAFAGLFLANSAAGAAGGGGSCLLIGDSTIVGSAGEMQHLLGHPCAVAAKVGASTAAIGGWSHPEARYDFAVIGAGSNDADSPALRQRLQRLRGNVNAQRVVWLMPYNARARQLVEEVAAQAGDATVPLAAFATRDHIHPASYKPVAQRLIKGEPAGPLRRAASSPVRMAKASVAPAAQTARAQPRAAVQRVVYHDPRLALAMVTRPSIARPVLTRPTISRPTIALP
jgi:hypothetical protein